MTVYSKEFKEQALKLADEIGLKKASIELGIKYCTFAGCGRVRSKENIQSNIGGEITPLTER